MFRDMVVSRCIQGNFMKIFDAQFRPFARKSLFVLASAAPLLLVSAAHAATLVVTPGEQNTQSGENGCNAEPCAGGHWLHYPELLQKALGADHTVLNNGDGGAVLGCDDATKAFAGGNSFCASGKFNDSTKNPPNIVIIGPFGEHDQRLVATSAQNVAMYDTEAVFESAYEGMVQKYLKYTQQIIMMTPIDLQWNAPAMPQGKDLVKDAMLPAATKVAQNHNLKLVDTYTVMTSTPELVTMYYGNDGQVNQAGQQKMADLLLAAINDNGSGGAGGAGGAAGAAGSGGAGGALAGAGGVAAGGGAAGSPAGASFGGTGGAAGAGGAGGGLAGAPTGVTGGSGGSAAGSTFTAPAAPSSNDSGGCSLSGSGSSTGSRWLGLALIGCLTALALRRR
jgi:hypothetical protein